MSLKKKNGINFEDSGDTYYLIKCERIAKNLRLKKKLSKQMKQFYDKENYSWFDSKSKTWRYFIDKNKQQSDDNTEHIYNIYVDNKLVEDTIDSKLQKIISTILKKKELKCFFNKKATYVSVNCKEEIIPFFYRRSDTQDIVYVCLTKEDKINLS